MLPIQSSLRALWDTEKSIGASRFFKTGKGEYGEGDIFLGITVPNVRKIVKHHQDEMNLKKVLILLESKYHEERLAWILTLVIFADKKIYPIKQIAEFYISQKQYINNWDLIDSSAPNILWPYISDIVTHDERKKFIDESIKSSDLWTNRMIILASFYEIKKGNEKMTIYIVENILKQIQNHPSHSHDLIQKACGWMLREIGKRIDMNILRGFLDIHKDILPRTMLRYSLEHLPKEERDFYMGR